ncbi:MAG TPA: fatty acid desaturase, partial [Fimbriiglobus sp.]|nr:fatty acid desaturase [Fimbriiglobus sp.]
MSDILPSSVRRALGERSLPLDARASLGKQLVTAGAIIVPFLGLVAGVALAWGWGFSWVDLGLLVSMTVLTGLGITVGFHRLFTHRSFETNPVVQYVFAVLGSMAVQGPLLKWVATHRQHHQHSDTPDDPHTPHHHGRGLLGLLRGFWHAHVGWTLGPDVAGLGRYVPDLRRSTATRVVSALFPLWVVLGLAVPAALGGLLSWSWQGAVLGLIWGGLVRVLL